MRPKNEVLSDEVLKKLEKIVERLEQIEEVFKIYQEPQYLYARSMIYWEEEE